MGGKPTHIVFSPPNFIPKYIGVGEDHVGAYALDFSNETHKNKLLELLKDKKSTTLWYEGPREDAKSKSFNNFVERFKSFIKSNNLNVTIKEKGWEEGYLIPKETDYTNILLGAEPEYVIEMAGFELNGRQSLFDAIVRCGKFKGSQSFAVTPRDLENCLRGSDVLAEMKKPNSATKETVQRIYGGGGLRDKYYEGVPGARKNSAIYKRVKSANSDRDKHLASKMKSDGGIFLAGDGHIQFVSRYL